MKIINFDHFALFFRFDIMNAGLPIAETDIKSALGKAPHAQFKVLDDMKLFMENMELIQKKSPDVADANVPREGDELIAPMSGFSYGELRKIAAQNAMEDSPAQLPWQKGIICSINATKGLYEDLVESGKLKYLLTRRLNQGN